MVLTAAHQPVVLPAGMDRVRGRAGRFDVLSVERTVPHTEVAARLDFPTTNHLPFAGSMFSGQPQPDVAVTT
jgi:hypothetical protein